MLDSLRRLAGYFFSTLPSLKKKKVDAKPHEFVEAAAEIRGREMGHGNVSWLKIFEEAAWEHAHTGGKNATTAKAAFDTWMKSGVHNEGAFPPWVRQYCRNVVERDIERENAIVAERKRVFKRTLAYIIYYVFYPLFRRK